MEIVTVAPASGTLLDPEPEPGANGRSRVIVPCIARWADGGATACRSEAFTRTTEPVRAGTVTFVDATCDTVLDQRDAELQTRPEASSRPW